LRFHSHGLFRSSVAPFNGERFVNLAPENAI
jgi:hypothetical protein